MQRFDVFDLKMNIHNNACLKQVCFRFNFAEAHFVRFQTGIMVLKQSFSPPPTLHTPDA